MLDQLIVTFLPFVPKSIVWKISKRYIAGESLDQALEVVAALNRDGMTATLDVLGEDSTTEAMAHQARDLYLKALTEIDARQLDCNISVKLSQMGLRFDSNLCEQIMQELLDEAARLDNFVRIDMEDSSVTTATLDVYRELRRRNDNVGTVVQSYLRRTEADVGALLEEPTRLRLCKGIYSEPEDIAYQDREEVRDSFKRLLRLMFDRGIVKVGIATHDAELVDDALEQLKQREVPREQYEFQMLLGVTEQLRTRLVEAGHPLRVYVPFGQDWLPYSLRRLKENPKIASHIVKGLFVKN